ncbi:hypothetical protein Trydic_g6427 [Trypoxylus dichotomus]
MSTFNFLNTFNNYSVAEFTEFLKNNGLAEFETLAIMKNIDGHTFLNLAQFEISSWRPLINAYQVQKFWSFLNQLKEAPENFVFVASSKPAIPSKPVVSKQNIQKLSQNPSFLNSLRAAVQNHVGAKPEKDQPQDWLKSESNLEQNAAPLPPRPFNKKPLLAPPKFTDSESEDELIYESPDSEGESDFRNKGFIKKPLPELPVPPSPTPVQVPLPKVSPTSVVQKKVEEPPAQSKPPRRQPFRLGDHYNRQREKERELQKLEAQKPQKVSQKVPQNDTPPAYRPPPIKHEPVKRSPSIPRPPRALPRVDVADVTDLPEPSKSPPLEQEKYYRYTDRKGAEELLSEEFSDGTYLIRPSGTYYVTLSVRQGDKVYHIGVKKLESGLLEMQSAGLDLKFPTLNEIIDHFTKNPITVRNKYNAIIDIYLNKTLPEDRT